MAKAVQLNSQDRVRFRGHRGGLIPMHRALAHYGLDRVEIITAVVLVILLSSVWLLLLPQVCHFWTKVLDTGIRVLPLRAEVGLHEYHLTSNVSLVVPYPGMEAVLPDTRTWAVTGIVTILLFAVTYFLPSHLVPVIYLLRGVLLIQATALVYFGLIPAEFPHTPSGYLHPAFGRLKLEYPTQNVSPDRPESLNVRLQRMEHACGSTIYPTIFGDEFVGS